MLYSIKTHGIGVMGTVINTFYKFLIRRGFTETSPIKNLSLPKPERKLPQFLTLPQVLALLQAPLHELNSLQQHPVSAGEQPARRRLQGELYARGMR